MKSKRTSLLRIWLGESLHHLLNIKWFILTGFVLFLIGGILGFIFSPHLGFFDGILEKLVEDIASMNAVELILYILANNAQSAFSAMVFGIFFGIVPVVSIVFNGLLVGYVFQRAAAIAGVLVIWRLIPHGIFELPAIFIAVGLGLYIGSFAFADISLWKRRLTKRLIISLKCFVTVVLPLLVIAAIIEGLLIAFVG